MNAFAAFAPSGPAYTTRVLRSKANAPLPAMLSLGSGITGTENFAGFVDVAAGGGAFAHAPTSNVPSSAANAAHSSCRFIVPLFTAVPSRDELAGHSFSGPVSRVAAAGRSARRHHHPAAGARRRPARGLGL